MRVILARNRSERNWARYRYWVALRHLFTTTPRQGTVPDYAIVQRVFLAGERSWFPWDVACIHGVDDDYERKDSEDSSSGHLVVRADNGTPLLPSLSISSSVLQADLSPKAQHTTTSHWSRPSPNSVARPIALPASAAAASSAMAAYSMPSLSSRWTGVVSAQLASSTTPGEAPPLSAESTPTAQNAADSVASLNAPMDLLTLQPAGSVAVHHEQGPSAKVRPLPQPVDTDGIVFQASDILAAAVESSSSVASAPDPLIAALQGNNAAAATVATHRLAAVESVPCSCDFSVTALQMLFEEAYTDVFSAVIKFL
jgi:hypothetical protein